MRTETWALDSLAPSTHDSTMQRLIRSTTRLSGRTILPNTQRSSSSSTNNKVDVESLLSEPTWSVSSLLPEQSRSVENSPITPEKLYHLLRLSALEPPKSAEEEQSMMRTLSDQLQFVRAVQVVDTSGVEPLRSLRDETKEAAEELENQTMQQYEEALAKEEVVGKFYKRIRRRKDLPCEKDSETMDGWKPVELAEKKFGKYFIVEKGKTGKD